VNCTACPAAGEAGLKVKDAVRAGTTVIVRLTFLDPELLATVRVTV
jgi:hypothetical protein